MIAAHVMSTDLIRLTTNASVEDALILFQTSSLHDFPVLDQAGKPVGIVTCRSYFKRCGVQFCRLPKKVNVQSSPLMLL